MLILSRKKEESIIIDGHIEIKILDSSDGKVKIGIEAPETVKILRKEVIDRVIEENKEASSKKIAKKELETLMKKD